MDALRAPTVGYADDVIILSNTKEDGANMLVDCNDIFAEASLEVGVEKTYGTATQSRDKDILKIGKDEIKWSSSITFVGTVLEFGGHDAKVLQYRTWPSDEKDRDAGPADLLEGAFLWTRGSKSSRLRSDPR